MDKDFNRTFNSCPVCGGASRFCEELGKEMKDRGLGREDWNFHFDVRNGGVIDPQKEPNIPIGSEVPTYAITLDICMDCGCMYAHKLVRGDVKKPAPAPVEGIHRAQRRRDAKGGSPFSLS